MTIPAFNYRVQLSPNRSSRYGKTIALGAFHTQQGGDPWAGAPGLANYLCRAASQVSYHRVVDNSGNVIEVVPQNQASWSVGNGNSVVDNVCFAGSDAAWSRQQWFDLMGNGIAIATYFLVKDALDAGRGARVIDWKTISAGGQGLTDHRGVNEALLHAKGHWDCGDGFPWDHVAELAEGFIQELTGPPVHVPTAIENCRAANEWLGDKTTVEAELATPEPNPEGRFAHYENGSIYFTPEHGAFAIDANVWPTFERRDYEKGELGFPIGPRILLSAYRRSAGNIVPGGTIQTFEGGTVYVQEDPAIGDGYIVKGRIRDLYAKSGYEGGPLGWPTTDERDHPVGKDQKFRNGVLVWNASKNEVTAYSLAGEPIAVDAPVVTPGPNGEIPIAYEPNQKPSPVGQLLADYAAGIPSAAALQSAGFSGVVRYVSDSRAAWMKGKPFGKAEADSLKARDMFIVSNYQYNQGGNTTSDWTVPSDGPGDARRGAELHTEAGGPPNAPIYVSVDAAPTRAMYERLVRPYLQGWVSVIGADRLGVYANGWVIDWLLADGIGKFYWQHNWASDSNAGKSYNSHHPAAHLHQVEIDKQTVAGIGIDKNVVLQPQFGQW